jgi:hypothetical protein
VEQDNLFWIPNRGLLQAREHMVQHPIRHTVNFIKSDGNCMFRAISQWKHGNQKHHARIRADLIGYSNLHKDTIEEEMAVRRDQETADGWITRMGKLGTWGDSLALELLAECYKIHLVVVSSFGGKGSPRCYSPDHEDGYSQIDVYFIFHEDRHFEILDPYGN